MFEVPDAKRVRREDLYKSASDDDGDDDASSRDEQVENELRGKLSAQLSGLLDFDFPAVEQPAAVVPRQDHGPEVAKEQQGGGEEGEEEGEEVEEDKAEPAAVAAQEPEELTFQFRLFRDEQPTHTVVITQNDEQELGTGEVGFVVPRRAMSYYVAGEPDQATLERFRSTAVSSDYILEDAKRRRWGLEKPWKVTAITISTAHPPGARLGSESGAGTTEGKRKRPGKKRRILLRTRDRAKKEAEEAAQKRLVDKEEHLKEKKKRLNREKKLKRRAKEREKKTATKESDE